MRTWLPHRPRAAAAASASAAALLLLSACTDYRADERGVRPPWVKARYAGDRIAAGVPAEAPLPRLKPPRERRYATLLAQGRHLVLPGDTLSELAASYGVSTRELARINGLDPSYAVRVGQILEVPQAPRAADPPVHVVRSGESLTLVAQRYGVAPRDLARANGLRRADLIRTGQRLRIPAPGGDGPGRGQVATAAVGAPPAAAEPVAYHPDLPAPEDGEGFLWPVRGEVVSTFGLKRSGRRNDGVNIKAQHGTPIRAAAAGVVAYVGDALPGFGNMILLRHADGLTTAYAHASAVLVEEGARVARGEAIARVGATGSVKEPQLHFELRRNGEAIDPLAELRRPGTTTVASSRS